MCLLCGHCAAICPQEAVSIPFMDSTHAQKRPEDWNIGYEKVATFLKGRRSIRSFENTNIDKSEIEKLIDVARYAPTGSNTQTIKWMVFSNDKMGALTKFIIDFLKSKKDSIGAEQQMFFNKIIGAWEKGQDPILRKSPHLILVHGISSPSTEIIKHIDGTIALDYFELIAAAAGFGTCWAGFFYFAIAEKYEPLMEYINLPKDHVCHGAVMFGKPKVKYHLIPSRNKADITWN